MRIDMHTHFLGAEALAYLQKNGRYLGVEVLQNNQDFSLKVYGRDYGKLPLLLWDHAKRFLTLSMRQLDIEVYSVPPFLFFYEADEGVAAEFARVQNDSMSECAQIYNGQIMAFATVPLQNVKRAIEEMERSIKLPGLRGIEICTMVGLLELDNHGFFPFWEAVEALGVPVMIHPPVEMSDNRISQLLGPIIGAPMGTVLAAAKILCSGVLNRFPRLRFILVHGGGGVPWLWGRLNYICQLRGCGFNLDNYKKNLFFDSITHSPMAIELIVRVFGHSQVLMGSDFPYQVGDPEPWESINKVSGLSIQEKKAIAGQNSAKLFGLVKES